MNEKNNKKTIFGWSMYDWAKSAYETTVLGAVLPVYFVSVIVPEEGFEFRGNIYTGAEVWGFAIGSALFIFFLINILLLLPLSPTIPMSPEGEPDCPFANSNSLSVTVVFVVLTVVVLPETDKSPDIVTSLKVTSEVVATACPIDISPLDNATPVPAEKCALVSLALGPVYVKAPVLLS